MAKTRLFCRARLNHNEALEVEVTKTATFNIPKGAQSPTVFFALDVEIPDDLLLYQMPVASIAINPADAHLLAGQARIGRLAVHEEPPAEDNDANEN